MHYRILMVCSNRYEVYEHGFALIPGFRRPCHRCGKPAVIAEIDGEKTYEEDPVPVVLCAKCLEIRRLELEREGKQYDPWNEVLVQAW